MVAFCFKLTIGEWLKKCHSILPINKYQKNDKDAGIISLKLSTDICLWHIELCVYIPILKCEVIANVRLCRKLNVPYSLVNVSNIGICSRENCMHSEMYVDENAINLNAFAATINDCIPISLSMR